MRAVSCVSRSWSTVARRSFSSGWQERDGVAARSISGMPETFGARRAIIFKPGKNAMQSGRGNQSEVKLQFQSNGRWENPLMGWASTADALGNVVLTFKSEEDAVGFCKEQGLSFEVEEPKPYERQHQSYANNFLYTGGPAKTDSKDDFW